MDQKKSGTDPFNACGGSRLAYNTPELRRFGLVAQLTDSGSSGGPEGGGGPQQFKLHP